MKIDTTAHPPDNYYEYESGIIVCGSCLDQDLRRTRTGEFIGDERVYQGMFTRLKDDHTEAYQCDDCGQQNEPYELLGEEP